MKNETVNAIMSMMRPPDIEDAAWWAQCEQFMKDLLMTGQAVMPDGEIVRLFEEPSEVFPKQPLGSVFRAQGEV